MITIIAAEQSDSSSLTSNRLILVVVGALLGFASAYLMELIKRRREPRRELSWDLEVDEPRLVYRAGSADRLRMSYDGRQVDRPVNIRYTAANTGNITIKDQFLRFEFPDRAVILDSTLDPKPAPEMGLEDVTWADPAFTGRRYKIGHLEPQQSITFLFMADGGDWRDWEAVPFNAEGDVSYLRRGVEQKRDDQHHVAPFLFLLAMFALATFYSFLLALVSYLLSRVYLNEFAALSIWLIVAIGTAALMVNAIPNAYRATRAVASTLLRLGEATRIETGGHSVVAFSPQGSVRITLPRSDDETSDRTMEPREPSAAQEGTSA